MKELSFTWPDGTSGGAVLRLDDNTKGVAAWVGWHWRVDVRIPGEEEVCCVAVSRLGEGVSTQCEAKVAAMSAFEEWKEGMRERPVAAP